MRKLFVSIFCLSGLFLYSCAQMDMFFHPSEYQKKSDANNAPLVKDFIHDTIVITNTVYGIREYASAGPRPTKQLTFNRIGQSYTFAEGESIQIVLDGVDMNNSTFDVQKDPVTDAVTITLVDKYNSKVVLQEKCQTIVRGGDVMPPIEVASGMDPEQIIITPIFDDECKQTGYQIRYGSEERGCKQQAKEVLSNYHKCVKTAKNVQNNDSYDSKKCKTRKKLGLPCK